jgi:hypothetical protein
MGVEVEASDGPAAESRSSAWPVSFRDEDGERMQRSHLSSLFGIDFTLDLFAGSRREGHSLGGR